jgi:6-pyruvoyltetrahydropterin/6-carboxytetrahydropterin synthase
MHKSTKTWGHNLGLSCCFRQWRATSHCNKMHGYAIAVTLTFCANTLDSRNWVMDFGGLKPIKSWLEDTFDHKTIVASDDPHLEYFKIAQAGGLLDLVVMDNVGCEAFAEHIYHHVNTWLHQNKHSPRVWLESVEVREHGANSAFYVRAN